jgi:hypothetical protein
MNLQPVWSKNLPRAHIKLELDVVGVAGKLVKYVVYSSQNKKK